MTSYDKTKTDVVPIQPLVETGSRRPCLVVIKGPNLGELHKVHDGDVIGRVDETAISVKGEGISRQHCQFIRTPDDEVYVQDLGSTNGTVVEGQRITRPTRLHDGDRLQIGVSTILKFVYHDALEAAFQADMYDASLRDPLTGLYNRRYLDECLEAEFEFARRHKAALTLCMLDIDHFKRINDTYGHEVGDRVLKGLGEVLGHTVRKEDTCCRYGGEEFVVVSLGIPLANGLLMSERLRKRVAEQSFDVGAAQLSLTVSLGVAGIPYGSILTPQSLLDAADQALYLAKSKGRNRSKVYIEA